MGAGDDVVADDVFCLLEPIERGAVKHLALEGDRAEHAVEAALAVGGDEQQTAIAEVVGVANFAGIFCGQREVRLDEAVRDGGDEFRAVDHADSPAS